MEQLIDPEIPFAILQKLQKHLQGMRVKKICINFVAAILFQSKLKNTGQKEY